MIIPIGQGIVRHGVNVSGTGYFRMPDPHFWDRAKNEMILIELGPGATYKYDFQFQFFIAFRDIEFVDGQPIITVLRQFGGTVERVMMAMEAETRRLGFIR
jgi:hypothetical protein